MYTWGTAAAGERLLEQRPDGGLGVRPAASSILLMVLSGWG